MGMLLQTNSFTDNKQHQLSNKFAYPSSHDNMNLNYKKSEIMQPTKFNYRIDRTKDKKEIKNITNVKVMKNNSMPKIKNKRKKTVQFHNHVHNSLNVGGSAFRFNAQEALHRNRRQISSQKVFHNISDDFFQSSASIQVLQPLDGESGLYSPDYPDPSLFEFVTEMSDKEFESLGFPVSPKPTDSFRLSGNDHSYGLIGSLGDHYDTDTGGFSGIEIISRESFLRRREVFLRILHN